MRTTRAFGRGVVAVSVGLMLAIACGVASASAGMRVFVRTAVPIQEYGLDGYGRAAWMEVSLAKGCDVVYGGVLETGSRQLLTPCVRDGLTYTGGPFPVGKTGLAATVLRGYSGLRAVWRQLGGGNSEDDAALWTSTPAGGAVRLGAWSIPCGAGDCTGGGTMLGPLAGRDGTIVYGVTTYNHPAGCSDPSCLHAVGGGVRRVIGGGTPPKLIPGAPAAAMLATACGRLAEQPYAGGVPAGQVQIRDATTGGLLATIPVSGTLGSMAMSCTAVAMLTHDAHGHHLLRYSATTGALLSSTWLKPSVDMTTIGIFGERVVYQNYTQVRVYRADLGRTVLIYRQTRRRDDLTIDRNGVRWLLPHGTGSEIVGIDLPHLS